MKDWEELGRVLKETLSYLGISIRPAFYILGLGRHSPWPGLLLQILSHCGEVVSTLSVAVFKEKPWILRREVQRRVRN